MAARQNLTIREAETFSFVHTHRDSAGAAIDLTGFTAVWKIAGWGQGSVALGGVAGTITLSLTPAQTTALADDGGGTGFGAYADAVWGAREGIINSATLKPEPFQRAYTVYITSSGGTVALALEGLCEIFRDVDV